MLLLRGYHKLPYREMYWETIPNTFVQVRSIHCLVMRSSLFFRASIFVTTNNVINKSKFSKLLPVIESIEVFFEQLEEIPRIIPVTEQGSK